MMPPAYATGICGSHVRGADARTYGRTNADNYSPCEDILLLSNAHAREPRFRLVREHYTATHPEKEIGR